MDFIDVLETAISNGDIPWIFEYNDRSIPLYPTSTDFNNNEPPEYITYDWYDTPFCYSDDEERALEINLTLHVFTTDRDDSLYSLIKKRLKSHEFVFQGSNGNYADGYPLHYEEILEFKISIETEE